MILSLIYTTFTGEITPIPTPKQKQGPGGVNSYVLEFSPWSLGFHDPIWRFAYFSKMKKTLVGWITVYMGLYYPVIFRDYFINPGIRIPINQPGFQWKESEGFFVAQMGWNPQISWRRQSFRSGLYELGADPETGRTPPFWWMRNDRKISDQLNIC